MWKCLLVCFCLVFVSINISSCGKNDKFSIIERKCGTCHGSSVVYSEKRSKSEWDRIIYAMKQRGLKLSSGEEKSIKEILYKNF